MLMVIQFVSKEINCFLPLLKSCKNGVIDFLRQGDGVCRQTEIHGTLELEI